MGAHLYLFELSEEIHESITLSPKFLSKIKTLPLDYQALDKILVAIEVLFQI